MSRDMLSRVDRIRLHRAMAYIDSVVITLKQERQKVELKIGFNERGSVIEVSVGGTELRLSRDQALMLALKLIEGVLEADRVEWLGWRS